jgi:hypothetical protein
MCQPIQHKRVIQGRPLVRHHTLLLLLQVTAALPLLLHNVHQTQLSCTSSTPLQPPHPVPYHLTLLLLLQRQLRPPAAIT